MSTITDKQILLQFIASLTLCEHMGDVSNDIDKVFDMLEINIEWSDLDELYKELGKMGITTLHGTKLGR